jgi:hypothetical protein
MGLHLTIRVCKVCALELGLKIVSSIKHANYNINRGIR